MGHYLLDFFYPGDSAGGNLATVISLKLRDEEFQPAVKQQVLIYPSVQFIDFHLPSMQQNAHTPIVKHRHMGFFASMYLVGNTSLVDIILRNHHVTKDVRQAVKASYIDYNWLPKRFREQGPYTELEIVEGNAHVWRSIKDKVMSPYMSPLLAKNLGNLPDAYVVTCQYDVLRDEGYLYAQRMKEFGTKVTYVNYESGFHGMINVADLLQEGQDLMDDMLRYLEKEL